MKASRRTDDETRAILDALRRILRHLRNAAATTHESLGISAAQLFVVQTLADAPNALSVNELAERSYADQSTVSVVAKRLAKKGLVARRRSAEDRRRVDLSVTPRGRALLRRSLVSPQRDIVDALGRLPPGTRGALAKLLVELLRAMGIEHAPAPMMFEDEARAAGAPSRASVRRRRDAQQKAPG
jgi:DNA-binding MarR family transcriptional regulator